MSLLASDFDKSKYFKAADFGSKPQKFKIKSVTAETLGVGDDKKNELVVWFTNDPHGLVLNRTNNRTLREAFGDPVDGWVGKVIVIYPTTVDMRGKTTPALRVRLPKAAATATPSPGNGAATSTSGNGATAPTAAPAPAATAAPVTAPAPEIDPDLIDDPEPSLADKMDDAIPF